MTKPTSTFEIPLDKVNTLISFSSSTVEKWKIGKKSPKKTIKKNRQKYTSPLHFNLHPDRHVELEKILQHELIPIPISLADTNGSLEIGNF